MSDLLQLQGLERRAADKLVIDKVRVMCRQIGLTVPRAGGSPEGGVLESWRSDARRSARQHPKSDARGLCGMLSLRIEALHQELRERPNHVSWLSTDELIPDVLTI